MTSSDLSLKLQIHMSNCLVGFPTCIYNSPIKLNLLQTEPLFYFHQPPCPPSVERPSFYQYSSKNLTPLSLNPTTRFSLNLLGSAFKLYLESDQFSPLSLNQDDYSGLPTSHSAPILPPSDPNDSIKTCQIIHLFI